MTDEELIRKAASLINAKKTKDGLFADVGCVLISSSNQIYQGVSVDIGSNALCAEQNAVAAMITKGEFIVKKIVAVWKDERGNIYVVAPCGNCRQFMKETDLENLEAEVILAKNKTVKLKELLPYNDWWQKVI
ncbi:cytidine deaminase [Candidatus Microgenomates bacterium]|nr:cytidine deaminase [Candidatus Microgenomates bacterium]